MHKWVFISLDELNEYASQQLIDNMGWAGFNYQFSLQNTMYIHSENSIIMSVNGVVVTWLPSKE